ncbi:hypothetical protein [Citrobacter freundii]|uniref:Uncharacterized protein n=1 Tax=Citrobacter freundii TaxID=546 RepID=A0A7G2IX39_CITFR|nr:hypothetical protein [Citrobacter freundii]
MHITSVKFPVFYLSEVSCLYRKVCLMLSRRHEYHLTEEKALKFQYEGS